jgi:hypothetical protein
MPNTKYGHRRNPLLGHSYQLQFSLFPAAAFISCAARCLPRHTTIPHAKSSR